VVLGGIDCINANYVGVDLLQEGNVTLAGSAVSQWVSVGGVAAGGAVRRIVLLVCDASEEAGQLLALLLIGLRSLSVQLRAVVRVKEVLSVDLDVWDVVVTGRRNTAEQCRSDGSNACKTNCNLHVVTKRKGENLSNEG
jgi:hypothetical protein